MARGSGPSVPSSARQVVYTLVMKIGLQLPNFTWSGGPAGLAQRLGEIARRADDAGFDSLSVMDHFFQIEFVGPAESDMLEAYTTLGFLAGITRRVRLGALVTGVTYRHPGVLAKMVASLDVLSQGRAWLGIGAAWFEREHAGLGVPFPPLGERFGRLEETLQICLQMWSGNDGPYAGRYYQLAETLCVPRPLTAPHPSILIGGLGEKKTLRLVARYGDACNLFARIGVDALRHKFEVLQRHCDDLGRDASEIERTVSIRLDLSPAGQSVSDLIGECRTLAKMGVDKVIFSLLEIGSLDTLDLLVDQVHPEIAGF